MSVIEERLAQAGLTLPEPAAPVASYVPAREAGGLLYVSGQLPIVAGKIVTGRLGKDRDVEEGVAAARACGLMLLAQARAAVGLARVAGCVQLGGFVACTKSFRDQPKVVNGASDLMELALGEAGRHSRFAVGAPSLPLGACVEVSAVFSLQQPGDLASGVVGGSAVSDELR